MWIVFVPKIAFVGLDNEMIIVSSVSSILSLMIVIGIVVIVSPAMIVAVPFVEV